LARDALVKKAACVKGADDDPIGGLGVTSRAHMISPSRWYRNETYRSERRRGLVRLEGPSHAHDPKRILFVAWRDVTHPKAGGSELLVDRLATGLAERGHAVSLLCGGPVVAYRQYATYCSGGTYTQYLKAPLKYLRSFRSTDLVVEVCNGMPFLVPLWRRGPSLCLVNHVHTQQWGLFFNPLVASFGRGMERDVMPRVYRHNLIVAVSPSTKVSLNEIGVEDELLREIPQGVSQPTALYPKSRTPLFVALGRLVGYKRIDLLLRIWRSVQPLTGGKLVIIGDGSDRDRLRLLAGHGVEFVGHVDEEEKHRLLCQAWALLHPAAWEGWGLAISEAGIRATPAVGFDVPGVHDAIVDGTTGLLATDEKEFASHWVMLAQSDALRTELGEAALKRTLASPWELTVDAFAEVAEEAVLRHEHRSVRTQEPRPLNSSD
jgi:glycosyltransferase involved in cell wall biosynthesis